MGHQAYISRGIVFYGEETHGTPSINFTGSFSREETYGTPSINFMGIVFHEKKHIGHQA